jgi:peptidoglycan/xylan/chitin deacetylase (PgdA/CDA1 family)
LVDLYRFRTAARDRRAMEPLRIRRELHRRERRRRRAAIALVGCALSLALIWLAGWNTAQPSPQRPKPRAAVVAPRRVVRLPGARRRPPQFLVVSFDGSGGVRLWPYWRAVARRARAHFTFFVSGVYLLDREHSALYHPPRHAAGASDIGFAFSEDGLEPRQVVGGMLRQIAAAYREGNEIGSHWGGHFCLGAPGNVSEWDASDWTQELTQFDALLFDASTRMHLRPRIRLPFGRAAVVGERTPCLEGDLHTLYPVLRAHGYRYDASAVALPNAWPSRIDGIWSLPLEDMPLLDHRDERVVTMDYNLFALQTGAHSSAASEAPALEAETYRTLWNAFRARYFGSRAPFIYGNHFETWNHWAYDKALARFAVEACRLPEVRCVSYRELADWLDAQPRGRLARYEAARFPRLTSRKLARSLSRVSRRRR